MRKIEWVDHNGYKRAALIKDDDPDHMAQFGMRLEPPPVDMLDWDGIKRDLHNALYDRGLLDWQDVQGLRGDVINVVVTSVLSNRVKHLLKQGGGV